METNDKNVLIEELPPLPQGVIDAYEQGNLAVFVGAGISRLMGCQGWDQMANDLIDDVCSPAMADQIKTGCLSSKEKITIAKRLALKSNEKANKFWETFEKAIKPNPQKDNIYDIVSLLDTLFLTTNCDGLLVAKFPYSFSTHCTVNEYIKHKDDNYVFCLHGNWGKGSDADKSTLIFTADEYLKAYRKGSELPEFLRTVMYDKTVLFIGYGLSEVDIINNALDPATSADNLKHYILEGFFQYQQELCNAKAEYYASINVRLIAYSKDTNDYEQQSAIITNWIKELKNKTSYNSRGTRRFTESLSDFNEDNKLAILQALERPDTLRNIFLQAMLEELPKNKYCYQWITFLFEKNIITPDQVPQIERHETGYRYSNWPILDCLKICLHKERPENQERLALVKFVKESLLLANSEDDIKANEPMLTNLWEVCLQLEVLPETEPEKSLWSYWASNSSLAITLIEKEYSSFICEVLKEPADLFSVFFSHGEKANADHRSYWFDRLAKQLIGCCSSDTICHITRQCITFLVTEEEFVDFYHSFDDRYHLAHYGYNMSLIKSIDLFMDSLNDEYQSALIVEMIKGSDTTFEYQVALHFAAKLNKGHITDFTCNPLLKSNTFVDFYLWLNNFLCRGNYSASDISTLDQWIDSASFGFDLDTENGWELRINVSKRINTYKYQLFCLIAQADPIYLEKCNQIKGEDRFDSKTPLEDKEQYYSIRDLPPEKYFEGIDLVGLSSEEIYNNIISEKDKSHWSDDYYPLHEIIKTALKKVTDTQLTEFFMLMLHKNGKELSAATALLSDDAFLTRISKQFLHNYLKKLYGVIVKSDDSLDETKRLISHLIYSLQHLDKVNWTSEEIVNLILTFKPTELFAHQELYHEDMDIIMNVINVSESQLYNLLIDKVADSKQNKTIVDEFKKWFQSLLTKKARKWVELSCAHGIQNLLYIDDKWTKEIIVQYLESAEDTTQIGLCMCSSTAVIIPFIVDYCSALGRIEAIAEITKKTECNYRNADSYVNYFAAAYYFSYLSDENYMRFIQTLDEDAMNHLAWTYFFGISGIDIAKRKIFLNKTIILLSSDFLKSKFAKAVFTYSSRCDELGAENWATIQEFSKYMIPPFENEWTVFEDCLSKTKIYAKEINSILEKLISSKVIPYEFTLDEILKSLSRLNDIDAIKRLASYAVGVGISPSKYSKYGEHPELAEKDFLSKNTNLQAGS